MRPARKGGGAEPAGTAEQENEEENEVQEHEAAAGETATASDRTSPEGGQAGSDNESKTSEMIRSQ